MGSVLTAEWPTSVLVSGSAYKQRRLGCLGLNPLVVGSIRTRPTNTDKGSVRKCWALVLPCA